MLAINSDKELGGRQQRQQIYRIYLLLRTKLPPELILPIICHAGLYDHHTTINPEYCAIRITNSPKLLLRTRPIAPITQTRYPVRKITFTITSKDQGYLAYPGYGSWTWFTVGVLKGDGGSVQHERSIVRNVTSGDGFLTQEIVYSTDSCNREERELVRSIQSGDSVVIMGHAEHRGWTNFVKAVGVTISEAVIA